MKVRKNHNREIDAAPGRHAAGPLNLKPILPALALSIPALVFAQPREALYSPGRNVVVNFALHDGVLMYSADALSIRMEKAGGIAAILEPSRKAQE